MHTQNILDFISALSENNDRVWFADNKAWYDQVKQEFEQLSTAVKMELATFDEEMKYVEVKDCIFRIYRDTRFSKDKTPYKTHFGVFFASDGGRKSQRGGYYLHLEPAGSFLGAGVWCPEPNLLRALRQSVYENIDELRAIMDADSFSAYFRTLYEADKLKTVPQGFPKDFPDAELLKLKHYLVEYKLQDTDLASENFVQIVATIFRQAYPFNKFLNYTVDELTKSK